MPSVPKITIFITFFMGFVPFRFFSAAILLYLTFPGIYGITGGINEAGGGLLA
jgi:hypothetical protein